MSRRERKRERGQSLVEIAISFPVLLLILSGLLDLGRVYYTYIALEDAAAEGAKYLALNPWCEIGNEDLVANGGTIPTRATITSNRANLCADPNNAIFRIVNANTQQVNWGDFATISTFVPAGVDVGDIVRVNIKYEFQFLTPGIRAIAQSLLLDVTATELVIDAR